MSIFKTLSSQKQQVTNRAKTRRNYSHSPYTLHSESIYPDAWSREPYYEEYGAHLSSLARRGWTAKHGDNAAEFNRLLAERQSEPDICIVPDCKRRKHQGSATSYCTPHRWMNSQTGSPVTPYPTRLERRKLKQRILRILDRNRHKSTGLITDDAVREAVGWFQTALSDCYRQPEKEHLGHIYRLIAKGGVGGEEMFAVVCSATLWAFERRDAFPDNGRHLPMFLGAASRHWHRLTNLDNKERTRIRNGKGKYNQATGRRIQEVMGKTLNEVVAAVQADEKAQEIRREIKGGGVAQPTPTGKLTEDHVDVHVHFENPAWNRGPNHRMAMVQLNDEYEREREHEARIHAAENAPALEKLQAYNDKLTDLLLRAKEEIDRLKSPPSVEQDDVA